MFSNFSSISKKILTILLIIITIESKIGHTNKCIGKLMATLTFRVRVYVNLGTLPVSGGQINQSKSTNKID